MAQGEGDLLADRYEVGRLLGSGGMAQVFEGRDRLLDRQVAIKLLHARYAFDPEFLARFRREARAAAGLSHAGVVAVYDTGEHEGTHYIVMEYVEGRTMAEVLAAEGALPPDRAVRVAGEAAGALAAAHGRGLVHRDVKPANIMLTTDDRVKVMDFGIARAVSETSPLTATSGVIGTPRYMSPEQVQAHPLDARSDLYSLGVCLYEWLTGRVPFDGTNALEVATQHVSARPRPPRELRADIPPGLEAVALRTLEKDPADRPQTGQQLRAELTGALDGAAPPPAARPAAPVPPVQTAVVEGPAMGPRRRSAGRLAAIVAVLLILGLAGLALGRSLSERSPADPAPAQSAAEVSPVTPEPTEDGGDSSGAETDEDAGEPAPAPEPTAEETPAPSPEPTAPLTPTETDTAPTAEPTETETETEDEVD